MGETSTPLNVSPGVAGTARPRCTALQRPFIHTDPGRCSRREIMMSDTTRGFVGRRRDRKRGLPPGQHLTDGFPVLSTGPTPRVRKDDWELFVQAGPDTSMRWT